MQAFRAVICFCFVALSYSEQYVPGKPGGEWSEEDIRITRKRVWAMLEKKKVTVTQPVSEVSLLRLAFHDCLTYKDGTGGCDGCLNWKVMDVRAPSPFPSMKTYCDHNFEKPESTNNNGLNALVAGLEKIYTRPDWPSSAEPMPNGQTLFGTGKSRADLWQFAAIVALESIVERSDFACRHDNWERQQVPLLEGVDKGLGKAFGIWKCKFKLSNYKLTQFKYGRKDCIPDHTGLPEESQFAYATMKEENQENPHENAPELLDNVRKNLGMSSRDFIALISIHGLIHPFQDGSIGSKYAWFGSGPYLSNMYYKFLVNRPTYHWESGFDMKSNNKDRFNNGINLFPYALGDSEGKPVSFWGFRVSCSQCWNTQKDGTNLTMSGPCYFRPTKAASDCPNQGQLRKSCYSGWNDDMTRKVSDSRQCNGVSFTDDGVQIGGKPIKKLRSTPMGSIDQGKGNTFGWSNMFSLNWEVGMAYKFDLDPLNDRPSNCTGIELDDVTGVWEGTTISNSAFTSPRADCNRQDYVDPDEKKPIYEILEEYADDHDVWVNDFLAAWQRMAEIGYTKKRKRRGKKTKSTLKIAAQNAWFGYYKAKDLHQAEGKEMPDYTELIEEYKDKGGLVINRENIDPRVCGNHAMRCNTRVSEVYRDAATPIEANGQNCTSITSCNDPTWN